MRLTRQDRVLEPLTEEHCWKLLGLQDIGRLAFRQGDEVFVLPVNYILDGRDAVIRTQLHGPIAKVVAGIPAALQVEDIDEDSRTGWTVLAQVEAMPVDDDVEASLLETAGLRPWVSGERPFVVRLRVTALTGRRLNLPRATS